MARASPAYLRRLLPDSCGNVPHGRPRDRIGRKTGHDRTRPRSRARI